MNQRASGPPTFAYGELRRASGILLHVTSLPSPHGVGDLGPGAYHFADFLSQTKQSYWQVLPLTPTDQACGNSPYSSISTFAGNTLFISLQKLKEDGWLKDEDLAENKSFPEEYCRYSEAIEYKDNLLNPAYQNFKRNSNFRIDYEKFCAAHSDWLDDFALFVVIKRLQGNKAWGEWESSLRDRDPEILLSIKNTQADEIEKEKFLQYLFYKQWHSLKEYCHKKGLKFIGDIPIYVNYDSCDVWTNPHIFKLNGNKRMAAVAGVPPDYFSKTGQRWGNPVYDWEKLKEDGYSWWVLRMQHAFELYDLVRIDHFRGLVAYWEIPSHEKTAVNGRWVEVPVYDLLWRLSQHASLTDIIAEDLGLITPEVKKVMHDFSLAGMKVLLFAFGEDNPKHPYLPHNYENNCVVYTGTHDNNTVRGWFENEAGAGEKTRLSNYLNKNITADEISSELIKLAMRSRANLAVIPLQDVLGLGEESRMNIPSTTKGNWKWRVLAQQLDSSVAEMLRRITEETGRG